MGVLFTCEGNDRVKIGNNMFLKRRMALHEWFMLATRAVSLRHAELKDVLE